MATTWMNVTINSIEFQPAYEDLPSQEGYHYAIISLTEQNTDDVEIPLFDNDYYLDGIGLGYYIFPASPEEHDYAGARPDGYELEPEEKVQWVLPFLVPTDVDGLSLIHREMVMFDAGGSEERLYIVPITQ